MRSLPEISRDGGERVKWQSNIAAAALLELAAKLLVGGPQRWPQAHSLAKAAFDFDSVCGFDGYVRTVRRILQRPDYLGNLDTLSIQEARALEARMRETELGNKQVRDSFAAAGLGEPPDNAAVLGGEL